MSHVRTLGVRLRAALFAHVHQLGQTGLGLVLQRDPAHAICPECDVDFVPALTDARCPICGWLAVEPSEAPRRHGLHARQATGLGAAWFVGIVVFALLAHALYS
jgi:hypothetical protein